MSDPKDKPLGKEYYESLILKSRYKPKLRSVAESLVFPYTKNFRPLEIVNGQQFDNTFRGGDQVITISNHRSIWGIVYATEVANRLELRPQIFPMKADYVRSWKTRRLFHYLGVLA